MKKTLLAAALTLGFAGIAQAETSVTLYGLIDTGIGYHKEKSEVTNGVTTRSIDRTRTGLHDGTQKGQSGSRWGLKGVEDLGNGLRVEFQLESGFNITNGQQQANGSVADGNPAFSRQAWVGLSSDSWGSLRFGRQHNVGTDFLGGFDPFGGGFGLANGLSGFKSIDTNRVDNLVRYVTPNYSGFQFGIGYSFNQSGAQDWDSGDGVDTKNVRALTTGIRYANGPVSVGLSYDQRRSADFGGADRVTAKQWIIGAAYDFEVVKVSAAFGQARDGEFGGRGAGFGDGQAGWNPVGGQINNFDKGYKANSYLLGLTAPVGPGKVMASWAMTDPRSNPNRDTAWDMETEQTYALGYQYSLSKRTNVYAYGAYKKNVNFNDGSKSTAVAVGLRHQF